MPTRRQTFDSALSSAQTKRTEARLEWIDKLVDALVAVMPEKRASLELMRLDLRQANDDYTEVLNLADHAIIDRVTVIVANETLDREEAIRQIMEVISGFYGSPPEGNS